MSGNGSAPIASQGHGGAVVGSNRRVTATPPPTSGGGYLVPRDTISMPTASATTSLSLPPPVTSLPLPWDAGVGCRREAGRGSTGPWISVDLQAHTCHKAPSPGKSPSPSLVWVVSAPGCVSTGAPCWPQLTGAFSSLLPSLFSTSFTHPQKKTQSRL